MSEKPALNEYPDSPGRYEIRLKGHLDDRWASRFGDVVITLEDNGNTLLICPVIDQAMLHGVLKRVRDLGMPLVSISPIENDQSDTTDVKL